VIIGLPGETYHTVAETVKFMEKAKPQKFGFNIYTPYVGTPIYRNRRKFDVTIYPMSYEESWAKGRQGEYKCFVRTKELSREKIFELFTKLFKYYTELTGWKPGVGYN